MSGRLRPITLLAVVGLLLASLGAWVFVHRRAGAVERPRYIFVNETDDHAHDLAFKMSIKLAEKRSGVENALVFLKRLPPGRTIEQVATDLFERWQIGRQRAGRGILYLYSEQENLFKIEVSYELEALFPDFTSELYEGLHHLNTSHQAQPARVADALRKLWGRAAAKE